ncbi:hypothetical protein VCUG_02436 [Vavraia culicis subsp. floridensis]|uniref:NodB homology domain-containing protein n=1 Tax=Vavraia culicis (isolate floridensis) TaxID=948595 RepID=L2GR25_VAVCU|nr:uncharacterized protein VCUG_02436 [Vavraia culicis subsp. floridensis]ELA46074.1 hypothetical protein VCUG_02436 [Vavraia culicis subsp. floridensis]
MILLLFKHIAAVTVAAISFDEGPSQHTDQLLQYLRYYNLPVCFHVDPYRINDADLIARMAEHHEVGLAITEEIKNVRDIDRYIGKFKRITGLVPRFVRLPRFGWPEFAQQHCEQKNLIVTTPSLDTEDIELPNFIDFLIPTLLSLNATNEGLSLVLRDRFLYSVESIGVILHVLFHKNIKILPFTRFYAVNTQMKRVKGDTDKKSAQDELDGDITVEMHADEQETANRINKDRSEQIYQVECDDDEDLRDGVAPNSKEKNIETVLIEDIGDEDNTNHRKKEERSSGAGIFPKNPRISTSKINYNMIKDIKGLEQSLKKLRNFDRRGNQKDYASVSHEDHSYTSSLRMPYNENNTKVFALEYKIEDETNDLDARKKFEEEGSTFKRSSKLSDSKDFCKRKQGKRF